MAPKLLRWQHNHMCYHGDQREPSFIEAAYWIFFLVILWDQNGYHIFIKLKKKKNRPQATDS